MAGSVGLGGAECAGERVVGVEGGALESSVGEGERRTRHATGMLARLDGPGAVVQTVEGGLGDDDG